MREAGRASVPARLFRFREIMQPLSQLPAGAVRAVFTDVDGTLTTGGKLLPTTYQALWKWKESGGRLVLVTGRPAGWAESFARLWPVDAVVAENGGVTFLVGPRGLERRYAVPAGRLATDRRRLERAAREVERRVPGAKLSLDSRYAEVDLAIDYNEQVQLGPEAAGRIEQILRARGLHAVRSSVHVNFWAGDFDKLSACRKLLRAMRLGPQEAVYAGDSLNDEPMFRGFALSVGVANVREVLDQLTHPPKYVTPAREGRGFEQLVAKLLRGRQARRRARGLAS
jgi:HAD superfamily hydrolase (TIGR01484 family)